ncbi:uncharacterized protein [Apostichopus japonicus]|uniref:uncharacterized protein isoform X2 n=1 Tax=Stichopus japonicus TaxID=307972 RepID=UPI003AB64154
MMSFLKCGPLCTIRSFICSLHILCDNFNHFWTIRHILCLLKYFQARKCYSRRCQKWVQNVQRLELKGKGPEEISQNYALCSDHFEDDMFVNAKQRQRLTLDAVPTIFGNIELPVEPKASTRRKRKKKQPTGTTEKSGSQKIPVYRSSSLVCHAIRVKSGEDLKFALECYINRHDLRGAFIMSCVGSIQEASLRMADSTTVVYLSSPHEILALNGTLSDGGHLHICLSDVEGKVIGGHLKSAIINTTAEIVIGELPRLELTRVMDENTSYKELVVGERKGNSEADSSGEDEDILSSSSGPNSSKRAKKRRTPKSTVKLIDNTNGTPTVLVNNTLLKITDVKL